MKKCQVPPSSSTYTSLLAACAAIGALPRALALVEDMRDRDVPVTIQTYHTLLHVCACAKDDTTAWETLRRMEEDAVRA